MSGTPTFLNLALSLALAFFFGVAFEDFYDRASEPRPGGVRTFPLLALTGGVLYLIDPARLLPLSVGLLAIGGWLGVYYFHRVRTPSDNEIAAGMMIPVCNVLAFLLGPSALATPVWVPVGIAAAGVLFLTNRDKLHAFARNIEIAELATAGKFLILAGLVLPLLPNRPILDLTPMTPQQVWLAVVAISGISYTGYLLQRFVFPRGGVLITAALGGLYSSTATAISLARSARGGFTAAGEAEAGILLSTAVMYLRILIVVAVFNLPLAAVVAPSLATFALVAAASSALLYLTRRQPQAVSGTPPPPANPLAITTGFLFAVSFALLSILIAWARQHFGSSGLYAIASVAGIADVDPFVLSLAQDRGNITDSAGTAILLAASTNNILKAAYAIFAGGWQRARRPALGLLVLALGGALAALLMAR